MSTKKAGIYEDNTSFCACISKDAFMTAPDESGINKDCTEKSTDWIATDGKRCTDVGEINLFALVKNRECVHSSFEEITMIYKYLALLYMHGETFLLLINLSSRSFTFAALIRSTLILFQE